eukprot:6485047-Amphidinium_carterae.1
MLLVLHGVAETVRGWSEGCTCHDYLRHGLKGTHVSYQSRLAESFGKPWVTTCPLAGCRAHELATGDLEKILQSLGDAMLPEILQKTSLHGQIAAEDTANILSDFQLGTRHFQTVLEVKLRCWKELPWLLHGLCHSDESKARECAKACLDQYDTLPPNLRSPLILHWLGAESALRPCVESVAAGVNREALPAAALQEITLLRFVNLAERRIEGVHRTVKKDFGYNSPGPAAVSAAIRLDPLFAALERGTVNLEGFLEALHVARQTHKLSASLGVSSHPSLHRLRGSETRMRQFRFKTLKSLVYRCDDENPFADLSFIAKANDQTRNKQRLASGKVFSVPLTKQLAAHIWPVVLRHVRQVVAEGSIFSLPSVVDCADLEHAWEVHLPAE